MNDTELRLECLKLAAAKYSGLVDTETLIKDAQVIYDFCKPQHGPVPPVSFRRVPGGTYLND